MSRGLIPVLSAVVLAGGVAAAQPAPDPAAPPPADGAGAGSAVQPIEDAPPADMEGTDENPDAPRSTLEPVGTAPEKPAEQPRTGYPIEESQRPITLPTNMTEFSIGPRFQASPYIGADALRVRFGITSKIQLGLTWLMGGVFDDPSTPSDKLGFHVGKAAGLDITVLLTNWLGVKAGLPTYFDPYAMSFAAGAPMKFIFEKFAIGALDDVINIRLKEFAPRFDHEAFNAAAAYSLESGTQQSRGTVRVAGYGVYQHKPNLAIIGRFGVDYDLGSGGGSATGTGGATGTNTFIRGGVQLTPKKFLDVGASAGFDDLSRSGSFGLAGFLAVRI